MPDDMELQQNTGPSNSITVKLKEARRRYEESFSIHGVGHAMNSSTPGKVLWSLCVLAALIGAYVLNIVVYISI